MRTLAVLPVKSFARAKQRTELPPHQRAELAESMVRAVLEALAQVRGLDGVVVVTRELVVAELARHAIVIDDPEEAGHVPAARIGIREAVRRGAERVLLVPGDCPRMDPAELDELLATGPRVAVVPDRHGTGTNALLLAPPDAIEPSFGPGSRARHVAQGATVVSVPSLAFDVDTAEDLALL